MINVIVAVSADGVIGKERAIPWRLKSDMEHFKRMTLGHSVIMGRKTWESLPAKFRPLPERRNIVLSRRLGFAPEGAEVATSLEDALALTEKDEEVFFMGGEKVYREALPLAERLIITRVHTIVEGGDATFPTITPEAWNLASRREGKRGEKDEHNFTWEVYFPNLPYVEFANIRTRDQLETFRRIRAAEHCPFCPEHLASYHKKPILRQGEHWVLTENQWPYKGTVAHFLFICRHHVLVPQDLPSGAMDELARMIREVESSVGGGGFVMRMGDGILSGATVKHLHAQFICPKRGHERTFIPIGAGTCGLG